MDSYLYCLRFSLSLTFFNYPVELLTRRVFYWLAMANVAMLFFPTRGLRYKQRKSRFFVQILVQLAVAKYLLSCCNAFQSLLICCYGSVA